MKTFIDKDGIERLQIENYLRIHYTNKKNAIKEGLIKIDKKERNYTYKERREIFDLLPKRILCEVYGHFHPEVNLGANKRAHTLLHNPRYYRLDIIWVVNCFRDYFFNSHV